MTTDSKATQTVPNNTVAQSELEQFKGRDKRRKSLVIVTLILVVTLFGFMLWWHFIVSQRERTDDAYVGGTQVALTSQIQGTVVAVLAEENQTVDTGQVVAKLDSVDAQIALDKASNALALSVRQFRQLKEQAAQYDSTLASRKLDLARAKEDLKRREPLVTSEAVAGEEIQHARDAVSQALAVLQQTEHQSRAAHSLIDGSTVYTNPAVVQAKHAFIDAWLVMQRTSIMAPISGHVAQKVLQPGQRVQPGQPLLSIVPLSNVWVDANFKESQLRNLRIGQPAEVKSDLYGSEVIYHGIVTGIAAGTGAAFALLPAQNASGNWIKVIQRVPVRITLNPAEVERQPLRIGLSAQVTVDTHDRSGAVIPISASKSYKSETMAYAVDLAQATAQADAIIAKQP